MSEKITASKAHEPRFLTAADIRNRVEEIAEELAVKLRTEQPSADKVELEAYPLDTRKFVVLMSGFIRMN